MSNMQRMALRQRHGFQKALDVGTTLFAAGVKGDVRFVTVGHRDGPGSGIRRQRIVSSQKLKANSSLGKTLFAEGSATHARLGLRQPRYDRDVRS